MCHRPRNSSGKPGTEEEEDEGSSGIYSGNFRISSAGTKGSSSGKEESNGGANGSSGDSGVVAAGRVSPLLQGQRNLLPRREYKGRSSAFIHIRIATG